MTTGRDGLVHVVFELEVDDEGWPPVSGERVWAEPLGSDSYRIENTPWFVRNIAADDIVRAVPSNDTSWPVYVKKIRWGGNYAIRIIPFRTGRLAGSLQAVLELCAAHGAYGEGAGTYPIVALTIPPEADITRLRALLKQGQAEGWWDYEEGCVDNAWLALDS